MRAGVATPRRGRVLLCLLVGLVVGGGVGGGLVWFFNRSKIGPIEPAKPEPVLVQADELDLVPADAIGFAHVRIGGLWRTEQMAPLRKLIEKAGPEAIKTVEEGFAPSPFTIDRATVVATSQAGEGGRPETMWVVIFAFSEPFNTRIVRETNLPNATEQKSGGKTYWLHKDEKTGTDVAVHFPNAKWMVLGSGQAVEAFLARRPRPDGPLAPAIALAAGGTRHIVAGLNLQHEVIAKALGRAKEEVPAEFASIFEVETLSISAMLEKELTIELRAGYKDAATAGKAEASLRTAAKKARDLVDKARPELQKALAGKAGKKLRSVAELPEAVMAVFGLAGLNSTDEFLADPPLRQEDTEVALRLTISNDANGSVMVAGVATGLMLPAVQKVREAAARTSSMNNLKQIGLAIHNFDATYNRFPQDIKDKNGKPLLSWRVELLPFIEQQALYNQFKRDEPWDSPHNAPLSRAMIKTFLSPNAPQMASPEGYGLTSYKGVVGNGTVFGPNAPRGVEHILDGTSNTVMVMEAGQPIPWAKPGDYTVDLSRPLTVKPTSPGMGSRLNVVMCDGSVRSVDTARMSEKTLRIVFGSSDGEVTPSDWDQ